VCIAAITLCVASQRVFVVVDFVIEKSPETFGYTLVFKIDKGCYWRLSVIFRFRKMQ
jgi:hypothetical protein